MSEIVTLNYDRLDENRETKLAWCFVFDGAYYYFPKSQVEDIRETSKELDVPLWLVITKGLEDYVI